MWFTDVAHDEQILTEIKFPSTMMATFFWLHLLSRFGKGTWNTQSNNLC